MASQSTSAGVQQGLSLPGPQISALGRSQSTDPADATCCRFESEKMIALVDDNADGKLEFAEFYDMMAIATNKDRVSSHNMQLALFSVLPMSVFNLGACVYILILILFLAVNSHFGCQFRLSILSLAMLKDPTSSKQAKTLLDIKNQLEAVQSLFTIFDTDADGLVDFHIGVEHMHRIVSCLGERWIDDDVTHAVSCSPPSPPFLSLCPSLSSLRVLSMLYLSFCSLSLLYIHSPECHQVLKICTEISKGFPAANFRSFCEICVDTNKSPLIQKLLAHFRQLKQLFSQWDDDGSGDIDVAELTRILQVLGRYKLTVLFAGLFVFLVGLLCVISG